MKIVNVGHTMRDFAHCYRRGERLGFGRGGGGFLTTIDTPVERGGEADGDYLKNLKDYGSELTLKHRATRPYRNLNASISYSRQVVPSS